MRPILLSLLLCVAAPACADDAPPVRDGQPHGGVKLSSDQCGLSTPYNVLVDSGGVWLYRRQGVPQEIFFHGGQLSVDHEVREVSPADARRLWRMEDQARRLMPQVADIGRGAIDITYDALAGVVEALTGSRRKARKIDAQRDDALAYIDRTLGSGRWDQEVFDEGFEQRIEAAAGQMAASLSRSVLWQVMTGRAEAMEARAERMDQAMDARMDAKAAALETSARALCPTVHELYALQSALDYRYQGQPLRMIEMDQDAAGDEVVARSAPSSDDDSDHRDPAISLGGQVR